MVFSVGFFTWLSFRQAVINDRRLAQGQPPVEKETSDKKVYVWPDLVYIEFLATIIGGIVLLVWSLCIHAPLEQAATPAWTPILLKPHGTFWVCKKCWFIMIRG